MTNFFTNAIDELYNLIIQPINDTYKKQAILYYKKKLNMNYNESFGEYYYKIKTEKKSKGVVYTPYKISNYIIKNTIDKSKVLNNPYIKIVDPSCGTGNLIIPCFLYLREIYTENLSYFNLKFNLNLDENNINKHIIQNNLYGFDIDDISIKILEIDLFVKSGYIDIKNFVHGDFLTAKVNTKFDIIIANPPYIGKKNIDKDYSKTIKSLYKDIYKDKSDIVYCFFQKSLQIIKVNGRLGFIMSRYFMESPSGKELRKILKQFCIIYKIVDFYGIRPFKNVGIDPVMIFLVYNEKDNYDIEVIKPKSNTKNIYFFESNNELKKFYINKNILDNERWIIRDECERNIVKKIENKCFTNLNNICYSYQGIITGCDKAFIVNSEDIKREKLERELIKPWIKNSYIKKLEVKRNDKYIIYTNFIDDIQKYPRTLNHIIKYKQKLSQRRECRNGSKKWYEIQWGRDYTIFEGEKIVFPYKSHINRFALDKGSYFSADVYCLVLKKNVPFTYEYLLFLLNSKIYEFYFKTYAKKLGSNIYEYYPNNVMKLSIPVFKDFNNDEEELYKFFEFNDEEIKIINQNTKD